ncbi:MAG: DUF3307 domain-containing protein [Lachnospiraceae bacterium]|nr:DUF3307 domain-containing protein [Lachnospiraceae bacterium]
MINKYLLILGIGHLLGDFYFQNEKMAKRKDEEYAGVLWHSFVYYIAVLLIVLPIFDLNMLFAATCMALSHFVIDSEKYVLLRKRRIRKNAKVFVIDQCMHIISIFIIVYIMDCQKLSISYIGIVNNILNAYGYNAEILARWILAILFIHIPANILIQNFLEDYKPKSNEAVIKNDNRAGRRIGTIERLIMLVFLAMDQYAAMGFVLTAKSIARYDKITKDEKFAEYYLLGTLVSTLCVITCRVLILN